jgi:hypothetical protein
VDCSGPQGLSGLRLLRAHEGSQGPQDLQELPSFSRLQDISGGCRGLLRGRGLLPGHRDFSRSPSSPEAQSFSRRLRTSQRLRGLLRATGTSRGPGDFLQSSRGLLQRRGTSPGTPGLLQAAVDFSRGPQRDFSRGPRGLLRGPTGTAVGDFSRAPELLQRRNVDFSRGCREPLSDRNFSRAPQDRKPQGLLQAETSQGTGTHLGSGLLPRDSLDSRAPRSLSGLEGLLQSPRDYSRSPRGLPGAPRDFSETFQSCVRLLQRL